MSLLLFAHTQCVIKYSKTVGDSGRMVATVQQQQCVFLHVGAFGAAGHAKSPMLTWAATVVISRMSVYLAEGKRGL